jgi:hypothetical protein
VPPSQGQRRLGLPLLEINLRLHEKGSEGRWRRLGLEKPRRFFVARYSGVKAASTDFDFA